MVGPVIITPAGDLEWGTEPATISRGASRYIPACNLGGGVPGRGNSDGAFFQLVKCTTSRPP
jgi:hypothetical protein